MKNEYKVTKKLFLSWAKEVNMYGVNKVLYIGWSILTLGSIGLLILCATQNANALNWYSSILLLAVCVFKLFFSRPLSALKRYKMVSKQIGVPEWTRIIEFNEDEIILRDHDYHSNFRYSDIRNVVEKGNEILIYLNGNIAIRLYKDTFVEGSWVECKAKIDLMRQ